MTLRPITADNLSTPHGFFSREGGVSTGVYAGLNCGPGSADDPAAVAENRARVVNTLGATDLASLHQIHSATALTVRRPLPAQRPKGDGMVSRDPALAVGALSADCAPILFEDAEANIVAAAHAGWKGALGGVAEATIDRMVAEGAERSRIRAAIGPCISQRAYEVGPEFFEDFIAEDMEYQRFFAGGKGDRMQFDLPGFLLFRLREAGVDATWTGHCTYADPGRFYSYRRTCHEGGGDYGRLIAAIRPRGT